jgi:selenocysteine lyase/cysteine desulfurase
MIIANNYDFEPGYIEPVARVVMVRFGKEESGGMLRVGPVHYSTLEEIRRFGETCSRRCLTMGVTC